ncbi:1,4-alpha-glucan branching enzyme [Pillotina sp. SPG140]|jgi:1,4-alpha-glucan branching enzyme
MEKHHTIVFVLNAYVPFVPHTEGPSSAEEVTFFTAISETYLPLLALFDQLDGEHIPFHLGIVLSPTLCCALNDPYLIQRYLNYVDYQIEFGRRELQRVADIPEQYLLAKKFYDTVIDNRFLFTERYDRNILSIFRHYQKKGYIELIMTSATAAFLPFYVDRPESVQAQIETAITTHRNFFGKYEKGFLLPVLGWIPALEQYLCAYQFCYTIVNAHGLLLGQPMPKKAIFYPVKTPKGLCIVAQDPSVQKDLALFVRANGYKDTTTDLGFDLPAEQIAEFRDIWGRRVHTGLSYAAYGQQCYNSDHAKKQVSYHAKHFLESRINRFKVVETFIQEPALSLAVFDADIFGHQWYEGIHFLEMLFRETARQDFVRFAKPSDYIFEQNSNNFETVIPCFSSRGELGYAGEWLDSSNDWVYRHLMHSLDRMVELAERFPSESGIRERALNQATRELLLAQSTDWMSALYHRKQADIAKYTLEQNLRNFTTIYESLGGTRLNTEWLTTLEQRHRIFPDINYRVFRKKI